MEYGIIGMPLGHSFSKPIHESISKITYEINPLSENEVLSLLAKRDFKGINVTIPYKQFVIPQLDFVDTKAKEINAVNTIINKNNKLYGFNTDYGGLKRMILDHKIDVKNKLCAILGNGGTHNTSYHLLKDLGAKNIITVTREKLDDTITFEEFKSHSEIEVIINTTPVGMYPNNHKEIISLDNFPNLEALVDVVYNPIRTPLVIKALRKGINATGGLEMLINQAIIANEIFFDHKNDDSLYKSIYANIYYSKANIVLIGMPMSGKSTIGKALSEKLNKTFVDIDEEIIKRINMPISEYFSKYGEDKFRDIEEEVTSEIAKMNNAIISTGGGIIKRVNNLLYLKENGFIVHLTRDEDLLVYDNSRPLTKTTNDYKKLKEERLPIYRMNQDIEIDNSKEIDEVVKLIEEAFYESINY